MGPVREPASRPSAHSPWAFLARWGSWIALALVLVLVAGFVELSEELLEGDAGSTRLLGVDAAILHLAAAIRRPWLSGIAMDLTALGSPVLVALFTIAAGALLLARGDRRGAGVLAVACLASALLTIATKTFLERPRPEVVPRLVAVTGLSYPSGHSLISAAVYLTSAFVVARHVGRLHQRIAALGFAAGLVLLVGASRVYLGVHYPSDVLGGMLLGTALAFLVATVLRRTDARSHAAH
jgi:undecaprenyl-diphosphatase